MLTDGSENLFYLAYGMPQSRTSRRADENIIDINKLPLGIYFYKVIQLNNSQYSGKLLIE